MTEGGEACAIGQRITDKAIKILYSSTADVIAFSLAFTHTKPLTHKDDSSERSPHEPCHELMPLEKSKVNVIYHNASNLRP